MGWKRIKDHYQIKHIVSVNQKGCVCIGSSYIHDLIVVEPDGKISKSYEGNSNADLARYQRELDADPALLKKLLSEPDVFESAHTVYTYEGGRIIKEQCEELGWPNVTHKGDLMYENTHSADRDQVVQWAKRNALAGIRLCEKAISKAQEDIAELQRDLDQSKRDLELLEINEKKED